MHWWLTFLPSWLCFLPNSHHYTHNPEMRFCFIGTSFACFQLVLTNEKKVMLENCSRSSSKGLLWATCMIASTCSVETYEMNKPRFCLSLTCELNKIMNISEWCFNVSPCVPNFPLIHYISLWCLFLIKLLWWIYRAEPSLSEKDQKERVQRSKFVRGLVLSTIFDDDNL